MEIGKCHVILEIRFAFAKSHFFLKLHSNYHLFTSMKKNDKKNQCNHETNKKTTQNVQQMAMAAFHQFHTNKKKRLVSLLDNCSIVTPMQNTIFDNGCTQSAYSPGVYVVFSFQCKSKPNQTKQTDQRSNNLKRKREKKRKTATNSSQRILLSLFCNQYAPNKMDSHSIRFSTN